MRTPADWRRSLKMGARLPRITTLADVWESGEPTGPSSAWLHTAPPTSPPRHAFLTTDGGVSCPSTSLRVAVGGTEVATTTDPVPPTGTPSHAEAEVIAEWLGKQIVPQEKVARIGIFLGRHTIALPFTAKKAGTAQVKWYGRTAVRREGKNQHRLVLLAYGRAVFPVAGHGAVDMKLSTAGRRLLRGLERLRLIANGTFAPPGVTPVSAMSAISLRR